MDIHPETHSCASHQGLIYVAPQLRHQKAVSRRRYIQAGNKNYNIVTLVKTLTSQIHVPRQRRLLGIDPIWSTYCSSDSTTLGGRIFDQSINSPAVGTCTDTVAWKASCQPRGCLSIAKSSEFVFLLDTHNILPEARLLEVQENGGGPRVISKLHKRIWVEIPRTFIIRYFSRLGSQAGKPKYGRNCLHHNHCAHCFMIYINYEMR